MDNVEFHDVMYSGNGDVHQECVFSQTAGLTLRNSRFTNCSTMDISINRGDWWGQQPYGNVTIENTVFGHSTNEGGWHYYGLAWFVGEFDNAPRREQHVREHGSDRPAATSARRRTRASGPTTSAAAGAACPA